VQGAAGFGDQGRHAEFGEHVRGRCHLGRSAHRVLVRAFDDPRHGSGVGRGQLGGDVLTQPRLVIRRPGGLEGLDHGSGHALVEHAAQEFLAGRQPGRTLAHLDVGAQRGQHGGVTRRPRPAGEHGHAQAAPGYRGHHRDIGEGGDIGFQGLGWLARGFGGGDNVLDFAEVDLADDFGFAADALRGRVRGHKLRMLGFERPQLPH